ncbi:MAG: DUF4177 domain-containing protein [Maritimibacter sp.]
MFEYKVVPAPKRGKKAKGVKTAEDRFAHALSETINEMAADGWEYLRTDTLPSEERSGLRSRTTVFQNMLVFRRAPEAQAPRQEDPKADLADVAALHAPKLPSANEAQTPQDPAHAPETAPQTPPKMQQGYVQLEPRIEAAE